MTYLCQLISKDRTRRALLQVLLISLAAAISLAQQPRVASDQPNVERLRAHVTYLASDKLEGRRTGSAGAKLAAEYIAKEFARLGLRRTNGVDLPGMSILEADSPRRYQQDFPYVSNVELGKGNRFFLNSQRPDGSAEFMVSEDWLPLGFSSNAEIKDAEVVFAGYGISAPELKYDDYDSGVKNRVAIVFAGMPDGDSPHSQFARAAEIRFRVAAARAAGARALLIIATEANFKDDRLYRLTYDNAGEGGIPVIAISRAIAAKILETNGVNLSAYEKVADARKAAPTGPVSDGETTLANAITMASILRLPPRDRKLTIATDVVRREAPSFNVVGILPGSDPKLKDEALVIGAHYDHLGNGGEGSLAPREGEIHHGADDNASGVAGMLELARIFSAQGARPKRTIVFIAFSGEEEGLIGSNYYINHPVIPLTQTVAMINMDMIGRMKNNNLIVGGIGTAPEWRSMIESENQMQGLTINASATAGESMDTRSRSPNGAPLVVGANGRTIVSTEPGKNFVLTLNEDGFGPSDHSSFYSKQIPVLFFWTGTHEDYHKPSDTAAKINYEDEARILSLVARIVRDIDKNEKRPSYTVAKTESTGRSMGFRVYLGTIPNYADSTNGLLLDGVRDDSPAAKAGLKAGDRIVKLAGREVKNVYDYTYALGEMKAGQEYEVEALRGAEKVSLKITPAARK
jgi:aminopeptidase YwaD